ncbi:MAG: hypothetical protein JKY65_32340, partial [Planctomycetes bacterium]|nr:hypothetical protein [Planctomycetota bacterium]
TNHDCSLRPARRNIYRKLRGVSRVDVLGQTAPEPLELIRLVPGQPALRRLLVQEEIQVRGESYLRDPAEGGLGWSLRQLTLAERASPAELSVDLERGRRGRLVLDLALAQPGGAVVAVDLVPIREFVTPPASRGWPTGTRHLYHLRGEGRGSVDLETSRTLPGATWRISFPLRGDLPSGTYVLRVRPQGSSSRVWVGARAALEGLLEPGQPWRVRIPPGSKSVLVEAGSSSQGPSALGIMADGSRRPLQLGQATAVSSSWLGLELAAGSTPLAGWVVTATGATGPRHLPRAELRLVAEHLPLEVTLPPARRAAKLRARLYWSGLTTPPREGLALEITGPEGVARQPLEPVFELRSELLPKSSAGAVWASRSISITGLSSASTSVRVVGPASLSATLEERVAPPESIVHVFHGVRDGGAQRPAKPLLRAYRRHGRFRRLSPTRGGGREVFLRSPVALAPALVAPTLQPLLTSKSESIVLRGVEDLVELTRLVEAETPMAPVPVRRRVLPGRTLELELADPQFPNAASTDLRLYYRGVQPNPDPPWIKAWIDGERVLRERAIGGQGLLRAPDVPTGRSQLVVRVEGSLAGGKLYVATLAVPAVGDLRQFKAWAPGLGTKELRFRAPAAPGHQLLLEVYGKRPAGEAWTAWDLRIRSAQSQVQVERHYTAGLLSSQGPLIEQDGQRVWLRIRVLWENRDAARAPLEGSLRGRILPQDRVRALHLWEEKE